MELVKQWALALCMACIAAGLLQHFAAKTERFSVIKLVLTLYILVTAFTPLQALRYPETRYLPDLPDSMQTEAVETALNTDALVLQQAQQSLQETLRASCAAAGTPLARVEVTLQSTQTGVEVTQVQFVAQDSAQAQAAEQTIRAAVGEAAQITAGKDENT